MFLIDIRLKRSVKKVILKNGEILGFIAKCYKTQEMCEKAVDIANITKVS